MKLYYIKKVGSMIAFWAVTICLLYIVLMQLSTDPIMREVRAAFYCRDRYMEECMFEGNTDFFEGVNYVAFQENSDMPNVYAHFNVTALGMTIAETTEVSTMLKLRRIFAWHNFREGTIWIRYSVEVSNAEGKVITGSWKIPVKMKIKKMDGVWVVTDIDEPP